MAMIRSMLAGGFALAALAACNTTGPMTVKRVQLAEPVAVTAEELEPIAFQRGIVSIRHGTPIAHFPGQFGTNSPVRGQLCNSEMRAPATLDWTSTSRELSGWDDEIGVIFHDVMRGRGYNLAGDPNQLFDAQRDLGKARFAVGARIEEITGNFCNEHDLWYGLPLNRYSGEMYMRVRWELFDTLQQRSIANYETEGYYLHARVSNSGITDTFLGAFGSATEALATNPGFAEAIRKGKSATIQQVASPVGDRLSIPAIRKSEGSFADHTDRIVDAVVVLRGQGWHGSGFVISKDGLIMTNAHVVGDLDKIVVRLSTGVEIEGTVLRRNAVRDIALVKLPIGHPHPLPLDIRSARVPERVYAVGAPIDADRLQSTVSSGVVSAVRYKNEAGYEDIQADVDIHGGNSGGPLLDDKGNVIGVAYAGIGDSTFSTGLNLFIPIGQALESVNLQLGPEGK